MEMTSYYLISAQIIALALMGVLGQGARSVFGLYKLRVKHGVEWKPDWTFLTVSLATGGVIGIIVGVLLKTTEPLVIIPLAYAGVDAVEGLLNKRIEEQGIVKG